MEKKLNEAETQQNMKPLVHEFNKDSLKKSFTPKILVIFALVVIAGLATGFILSKNGSLNMAANNTLTTSSTDSKSIKKGDVIGVNDTSSFKDTTEGQVKEGGINGEGAFHLVRPGGESQNVYLTSSSVDLAKLINRKIKVWGATQKAQHAGWLMDVGKIQVLE